MSMQITNAYGTYTSEVYAATSAAAATDTTSTSGTDGTASTSSRTVAEYMSYLQQTYSIMRPNATSEGIPTTVIIDPSFLKQCANDPDKAAYLESWIEAFPRVTAMSVARCPGTLTQQIYAIDANGHAVAYCSGTNDPDGKIARENAKRKAEEKKEQQQELEEKRKARQKEREENYEKLQAKAAARAAELAETYDVADEEIQSEEGTLPGRTNDHAVEAYKAASQVTEPQLDYNVKA